jgi:hypothetical protein
MSDQQEIYVSTDVETDGPIPGPHSMLSFGSVAMLPDQTVVGEFTANLQTLSGATGHPDTMKFWEGQPDAWKACRTDTKDPAVVIPDYCAWLKALPGRPVFVGYPVVFDFMFVYWYLIKFAGESPFSFSALDIKTYGMALMGKPYMGCTKRNMPKRWFAGKEKFNHKHNHIALDDAKGQGVLFCNMMAERAKIFAPQPAAKAA